MNYLHMVTDPKKCGGNIRSIGYLILKIDMQSSMAEGIRFFRSDNGFILSSGDEQGRIPSKHLSIFLEIK